MRTRFSSIFCVSLLRRIVLKSVKSARSAWFATSQPDDDASVTAKITRR
jgi:hypothetical protein